MEIRHQIQRCGSSIRAGDSHAPGAIGGGDDALGPDPRLGGRQVRWRSSATYRGGSDRRARWRIGNRGWAVERCILPVAGYYVWQLTAARYRQPYFVQLSDRSVFGLAGVWDRSVGDDDDVIESFSVVCVPANDLMRRVASAEPLMPAILKRRDYRVWLGGNSCRGEVGAARVWVRRHAGACSKSPRQLGLDGRCRIDPADALTPAGDSLMSRRGTWKHRRAGLISMPG